MKSNINSDILNILEKMEIKENEKEYLKSTLNLEYDNNIKKRPKLDGKYKEFIEKYGD